MLKSKTTIVMVGGSRRLLIPVSLLNDSAYPFTDNDELEMIIVGDKIVVEKKREQQEEGG